MPRRTATAAIVLVAVLLGVGIVPLSLRIDPTERVRLANADPERGRHAIRRYGCGSCHTIEGVPGATAGIGPALGNLAHRGAIAGDLENTPDNLVRWIRHPQAIEPGTLTPEMDVTERDARDIAAYLYTLD
jgi:cytochrome c